MGADATGCVPPGPASSMNAVVSGPPGGGAGNDPRRRWRKPYLGWRVDAAAGRRLLARRARRGADRQLGHNLDIVDVALEPLEPELHGPTPHLPERNVRRGERRHEVLGDV